MQRVAMADPNQMDRDELEQYVRQLEEKNRQLQEGVRQAVKHIQTETETDERLAKTLQRVVEDSPEELPETKLDERSTEEVLDELEAAADEAIERMDDVGRW